MTCILTRNNHQKQRTWQFVDHSYLGSWNGERKQVISVLKPVLLIATSNYTFVMSPWQKISSFTCESRGFPQWFQEKKSPCVTFLHISFVLQVAVIIEPNRQYMVFQNQQEVCQWALSHCSFSARWFSKALFYLERTVRWIARVCTPQHKY